jgi:hypothetical protein
MKERVREHEKHVKNIKPASKAGFVMVKYMGK